MATAGQQAAAWIGGVGNAMLSGVASVLDAGMEVATVVSANANAGEAVREVAPLAVAQRGTVKP